MTGREERSNSLLQVVPLILGLVAVVVIMFLVGQEVREALDGFRATLGGTTAP